MAVIQCVHDMTVSHGLPVSLFLAGLVGGFTHCAGMCSPFVLAQTGDKKPEIKRLGSYLLIPYHLGRMTTYIALAVLVNAVLGAAFTSSGLKPLIAAPLLMLAAVIFLVSAFPRLRIFFPWAVSMKWNVPYGLFNRLAVSGDNLYSSLKRYGLGVLLGFMPCGLVLSSILASSTAQGIGQAALAMMAFTVGTMPALFMVALGGQALKYKYPQATRYLSRGAMVISSLWLLSLAGSMVLFGL